MNFSRDLSSSSYVLCVVCASLCVVTLATHLVRKSRRAGSFLLGMPMKLVPVSTIAIQSDVAHSVRLCLSSDTANEAGDEGLL